MADNKKLLNEASIRRFMKLAELEPLSNTFLDRHSPNDDLNETEDEIEELHELEPELDMPAEEEEELMPDEEDMDLDVEEAPAVEPEEMVQDLVTNLADAITKATGIAVSVETEGEPEEVFSMEDEVSDEVEADLEMADLEAEEEPLDDLEETADTEEDVVDEKLVHEVAKRVINRLLKKQ
jgi:hypothetical protein